MVNQYLTYFKNVPCSVAFAPATEANIIKIEAELTCRNFASIPEEYKTFLKLTDGISFNGIEFYGTTQHYRQEKDYTFPDLISVNKEYLNYDFFINKIIIGGISESLLLYDQTNKTYTITDRTNLRPHMEVNTFTDLLKIFYNISNHTSAHKK